MRLFLPQKELLPIKRLRSSISAENIFVTSIKEKAMSRIGRKPISIPDKVKISVDKANIVTVEGPKGKLTLQVSPRIKIIVEDSTVRVERPTDLKMDRAMHGLYRSLINNMIIGVTQGYKKELEMVGVGYKAQLKGKELVLDVGFSHPVSYHIPDGISIQTPKPTQIVIEGIDKQQVGQVAAEIRKVRPPEPYKGKGIRYAGERIRRKAGKAAGKK